MASSHTTATTQKEANPAHVTELRPSDVIMGRGLSASEYPGNRALRQMVQERRMDYVNCHSREGKQNIAREIIAAVKDKGGRFVRRHVAFLQNSDGSHAPQAVWQIVHKQDETINKVKQLLRDMAPAVKARREQRRRRQAQWARLNAYTNLFPDATENPFAQPQPGSARSCTTQAPTSAGGTGAAATRTAPTIQNSLNLRTPSLPQNVLKLPAVPVPPPTNHHNLEQSLSPSSLASLLGSEPMVSLADVQMLLVRQYQQAQQDEQKMRLLTSLSPSLLPTRRLEQTTTTSTTAAPSTATTPATTMTSPSSSLFARSDAQTQATSQVDPRLVVLLELQRHAEAAPHMSSSFMSEANQAPQLCTNNNNNICNNVAHRLHEALDLALLSTYTGTFDSHNSHSSAHSVLNAVSPPSQAVSTVSRSSLLGNLSVDDLAQLVLLERLQHLRH